MSEEQATEEGRYPPMSNSPPLNNPMVLLVVHEAHWLDWSLLAKNTLEEPSNSPN
jgi:hypothetical protein